jgi:hypothetical protein
MLVEFLFQLFVLFLGYLVGAAAVLFGARLIGLSFQANNAALLVLALPILSALVAEAFTGLWLHTPGTLGLGGLTAFMPMLTAAVVISLALLLAQRFLPAFDPEFPRDSGGVASWTGLALAGSALALALWRYWPEPRARLF